MTWSGPLPAPRNTRSEIGDNWKRRVSIVQFHSRFFIFADVESGQLSLLVSAKAAVGTSRALAAFRPITSHFVLSFS